MYVTSTCNITYIYIFNTCHRHAQCMFLCLSPGRQSKHIAASGVCFLDTRCPPELVLLSKPGAEGVDHWPNSQSTSTVQAETVPLPAFTMKSH